MTISLICLLLRGNFNRVSTKINGIKKKKKKRIKYYVRLEKYKSIKSNETEESKKKKKKGTENYLKKDLANVESSK